MTRRALKLLGSKRNEEALAALRDDTQESPWLLPSRLGL